MCFLGSSVIESEEAPQRKLVNNVVMSSGESYKIFGEAQWLIW